MVSCKVAYPILKTIECLKRYTKDAKLKRDCTQIAQTSNEYPNTGITFDGMINKIAAF